MKKSSKSFTPLYPTTYEKNKEELNRLNTEIIEASKQRNYPLAKKLQQEYNYCAKVDHYFTEQRLKQEKDDVITQIRNARLVDEEILKQRMRNKMRRSLPQYEQRLQALEKKHLENLNQIEHRFASPRYAAYRPSPTLHHMLKLESFYASQRDFDSAEQYRKLITRKAYQEIIESETNKEISYSAAIEAENRRYKIEKEGFHSRIENEKAKLKKETEAGLLQIKHKYSNLSLKNIELNKKTLSANKNMHINSTLTKNNDNQTDDNLNYANLDTPSNTKEKTDENNKSIFITTTNESDQQIGGEENVYQVLNDGFSEILQKTKIQNKESQFPVTEPQHHAFNLNQTSFKKPYARSPRTAGNKRRPVTKMLLSSIY